MTAVAAEPEATETEPELDRGVRIDGKVHEGPADFTLQETQYIRAQCDLTVGELAIMANDDQTNPDVIQAVAWTVLHRLDAKVEWEDVFKHEITVGTFWVTPEEPEEGKQGGPPGSRRKKSS